MGTSNGTKNGSAERKGVPKKRVFRVPAIYYALAVLVLLVIWFGIGNVNFVSAYNINTVASYAAILLVVSLGEMCAILVGGIDLSVGGIISFVSVLFATTVPAIGYWAYPLGIAAGAVVGYVNGLILTRIRIPSFIATLGTGGIMVSLALLVSPAAIDVPSKLYGILDLVNGSLLGIDNLLVLAILVFVIVYVLLRFTITGRNLFYVGSNIRMAWMSGINIAKTRNVAFVISGIGAAIAAMMISCVQFGGDPALGNVYILDSIAAVVVGGTALTGGTGGAVNTLIGALILSVLENGMNVIGIDAYFQQSILGLMIIVSVTLTFDRGVSPVIK